MATSKPLTTIDKKGLPGRPASVRKTAERVILRSIINGLLGSGLVAPATSKRIINSIATGISATVVNELQVKGIALVPHSLIEELGLLIGDGVKATGRDKPPDPPDPPATHMPDPPDDPPYAGE